MTSFTKRPGTSFTLPRMLSAPGGRKDPWKTMDVQEQKVKFVVAASRREKSLTALCQEFGISRPTGLLWRKRYEAKGVAGIAEGSRRPRRSPEQTKAELERRVLELRGRYPDWGARKLRVLLAREQVELTRSTIHPHSVAAQSAART